MIVEKLKALPSSAVEAAVNDPALRVFWIQYAVIAAICLFADPLIHWLTH